MSTKKSTEAAHGEGMKNFYSHMCGKTFTSSSSRRQYVESVHFEFDARVLTRASNSK